MKDIVCSSSRKSLVSRWRTPPCSSNQSGDSHRDKYAVHVHNSHHFPSRVISTRRNIWCSRFDLVVLRSIDAQSRGSQTHSLWPTSDRSIAHSPLLDLCTTNQIDFLQIKELADDTRMISVHVLEAKIPRSAWPPTRSNTFVRCSDARECPRALGR